MLVVLGFLLAQGASTSVALDSDSTDSSHRDQRASWADYAKPSALVCGTRHWRNRCLGARGLGGIDVFNYEPRNGIGGLGRRRAARGGTIHDADRDVRRRSWRGDWRWRVDGVDAGETARKFD